MWKIVLTILKLCVLRRSKNIKHDHFSVTAVTTIALLHSIKSGIRFWAGPKPTGDVLEVYTVKASYGPN